MVKTAAADDHVANKRAVGDVAASLPLALPRDEQLPSLPGCQRLVGHPAHPRPKMTSAFSHRAPQCLSVLDTPPARPEVIRPTDDLRQSLDRPSHLRKVPRRLDPMIVHRSNRRLQPKT